MPSSNYDLFVQGEPTSWERCVGAGCRGASGGRGSGYVRARSGTGGAAISGEPSASGGPAVSGGAAASGDEQSPEEQRRIPGPGRSMQQTASEDSDVSCVTLSSVGGVPSPQVLPRIIEDSAGDEEMAGEASGDQGRPPPETPERPRLGAVIALQSSSIEPVAPQPVAAVADLVSPSAVAPIAD